MTRIREGIQLSLPFAQESARPVFHYDEPGWDDRHVEAKVDALIADGFTLPPNRYPLLKDYNGATGQERRTGGGKWTVALLNKLVPLPTLCSICLSTRNLQNHNENYFRPCAARPLCKRCHFMLHRRFRAPHSWLTHAHQHHYEGAWFTRIAMEEITRDEARYLATLQDPIDAEQLMPRRYPPEGDWPVMSSRTSVTTETN